MNENKIENCLHCIEVFIADYLPTITLFFRRYWRFPQQASASSYTYCSDLHWGGPAAELDVWIALVDFTTFIT